MSVQISSCANPEAAGFDVQKAAEDVWDVLLSIGAFSEGSFTFAAGTSATLKVDAERLYRYPKQLARVLGHFAAFPCVKEADVLLYVPEGWRDFTTMLGNELEKPVAHARRKLNAPSRYDFIFESLADEDLAHSAERLVIGEDIVSTLGSVAGMRKLLKENQNVHSLAMLLRGTVNPDYQLGLVDHYLLQREIPTDKEEFHRRLQEEWQ